MVITILDAPLPTNVYTPVSKHESLDSSGPASGTKKRPKLSKYVSRFFVRIHIFSTNTYDSYLIFYNLNISD